MHLKQQVTSLPSTEDHTEAQRSGRTCPASLDQEAAEQSFAWFQSSRPGGPAAVWRTEACREWLQTCPLGFLPLLLLVPCPHSRRSCGIDTSAPKGSRFYLLPQFVTWLFWAGSWCELRGGSSDLAPPPSASVDLGHIASLSPTYNSRPNVTRSLGRWTERTCKAL